MSDTKVSIDEENRRRIRVNKIKKVIICLVIVFAVVPTIICGMLMVKVVMLEKQIKKLKTDLIQARAQVETLMLNETEGIETEVMNEVETNVKTESEEVTMPDSEQEFFEVNDVDEAAQTAEIVEKQDGKKVYLTFDDGPSSNTDAILDVLKEYDVKATFFVIAKSDDESVRLYNRIVDEGHTLAMHSYTHAYGQIYADIDNYKNDVLTLQSYLYEVTGINPVIYRFPGGSSNTVMAVNIQECIAFLEEEGIKYFDWNVSSGDATGNGYSPEEIAQNVIEGVKKQDEAVVLLHDANSKDATVEALPIFIEQLLAMEDVMILPLEEDSYPIQHIKKQ